MLGFSPSKIGNKLFKKKYSIAIAEIAEAMMGTSYKDRRYFYEDAIEEEENRPALRHRFATTPTDGPADRHRVEMEGGGTVGLLVEVL